MEFQSQDSSLGGVLSILARQCLNSSIMCPLAAPASAEDREGRFMHKTQDQVERQMDLIKVFSGAIVLKKFCLVTFS